MESCDENPICPVCGQAHRTVALKSREQAACVRCGTLLATSDIGKSDAALAFTLTAWILIVPAALQPFVTVSKFGNQRISLALSGVGGLWDNEMPLLAAWVLVCGALAPLLLLAILVAFLIPARWRATPGRFSGLRRAGRWVQHWAMPEVQVLAVLVAFFKLGSVVNVAVGPGFWCYAAMSVALLLAWRNFNSDLVESTSRGLRAEENR